MREPRAFDAIRSLVPDAQVVVRGGVVEWHTPDPGLTAEQIETERVRLIDVWQAREIARRRLERRKARLVDAMEVVAERGLAGALRNGTLRDAEAAAVVELFPEWAQRAYQAGRIVVYQGGFYEAISNVNSTVEPPADPAAWRLLQQV